MSALNANDTSTPGFEPKIVEPNQPSPSSQAPITPKERLKAMFISIGTILAGIGMWVWPQFYLSDLVYRLLGNEPIHQFRPRLDIFWCRPTGVILIVLGALALWGVFTKKSKPA
jgi:hypothetical protein